MQKNNVFLLKKFKNTESAQLWLFNPLVPDAHKRRKHTIFFMSQTVKKHPMINCRILIVCIPVTNGLTGHKTGHASWILLALVQLWFIHHYLIYWFIDYCKLATNLTAEQLAWQL